MVQPWRDRTKAKHDGVEIDKMRKGVKEYKKKLATNYYSCDTINM